MYLIDPTLRSQYQALPLRAAADAHAGMIEWAIDGSRFGASHADEPLQWPLAPGTHRISARDELGRGGMKRMPVSILVNALKGRLKASPKELVQQANCE